MLARVLFPTDLSAYADAQAQQAATGYLREINTGISHMLGVDFGQLAKPPSGCC